MKGNLNILKSKFIKVFIAAILAVILLLSVLFSLQPGMKLFSAEEMAALTGDKFETIFPLGEFEEIYVADSEAGIFLVKRADKTKLIDTLAAWPGTTDRPTACHMLVTADGQALSHFPYAEVRSSAGGNFVIKEEDRWYFVNSAKAAESEIYTGKHYDYAEIDASGKYVLVKEEGTYRVLDAEGNEVYVPQNQETEYEHPDFMGPEGYIIEGGLDNQFIVNFKTGETEYEVPEGVRVAAYRAGHWFMDCAGEHSGLNFSYYYMLDKDYNLAADEAIFTGFDMSGSKSAAYVDVQQEPKVFYDNRDIMAKRGLFSGGSPLKVVYNKDGEAVYGAPGEGDLSQTHGNFIRYIRGNIAAVSTYNETVIDYINLDTQEVIFEDSGILCFMDWEDGAAAAVVNARKNMDRDDRSGRDLGKDKNADYYKWGLVDENLQPLTEFVFDGVNTGDNGYAVVMKDGYKGLIRLKGVS